MSYSAVGSPESLYPLSKDSVKAGEGWEVACQRVARCRQVPRSSGKQRELVATSVLSGQIEYRWLSITLTGLYVLGMLSHHLGRVPLWSLSNYILLFVCGLSCCLNQTQVQIPTERLLTTSIWKSLVPMSCSECSREYIEHRPGSAWGTVYQWLTVQTQNVVSAVSWHLPKNNIYMIIITNAMLHAQSCRQYTTCPSRQNNSFHDLTERAAYVDELQ